MEPSTLTVQSFMIQNDIIIDLLKDENIYENNLKLINTIDEGYIIDVYIIFVIIIIGFVFCKCGFFRIHA